MWTIFKVFIEFVTILLLFYVFWFFGLKARGILAPQPGIEPAPPAPEGEVLTTEPPGKSLFWVLTLKGKQNSQKWCGWSLDYCPFCLTTLQ